MAGDALVSPRRAMNGAFAALGAPNAPFIAGAHTSGAPPASLCMPSPLVTGGESRGVFKTHKPRDSTPHRVAPDTGVTGGANVRGLRSLKTIDNVVNGRFLLQTPSAHDPQGCVNRAALIRPDGLCPMANPRAGRALRPVCRRQRSVECSPWNELGRSSVVIGRAHV